MTDQLTCEEARVLGSLVEKSLTTPEYYPLSLNALKNACNQKSSREPVVEYTEKTVAGALDGLRDKHFVWFVDSADSRVQKYRHRMAEALDLAPEEVAVLAVLILRGAQTGGEIKGRTGRMHEFATVEEVESCLENLASREAGPLAVRLPRQAGRKEHRWSHTLCGVPEATQEVSEEARVREPSAFAEARSEKARLESLESEVASLKAEVVVLREAYEKLKGLLE